ncbi:hypothetical protein C8R41DRAFT_913292 [Lentinula lateritia]|uniref:RING-type domain-containing protein n=1 Tax=Lentinula lateritia TaxID=40482 RepID=A0ABQ8W062_9AGAR|nr:hypothetical protein C8R41DRAFT_913292 [Lentinula lateritia]
MHTNTPAVARRSRSPTPDRSSRSHIFGRPSPRPVRTYGRKSQSRLGPNTPSSCRAVSTPSVPSHRNRPLASSSVPSTYHLLSSTLDYEEPVILPATPPHDSTPTPCPPNTSTREVNNLNLESDDDDELVFISMNPPVELKPLQDVSLNEKLQTNPAPENALQNAQTRIQALNDVIKERNNCPCCLELMLQPFILSCGHTFCKDCLLTMSRIHLRAKYNLACPSCRTIQGHFTPIPNYSIQKSVDDMLEIKGIPTPTRQPLQWPHAFRSGPVTFPFPRRNGTYPTAASAAAPVPFPISIDD